MGQDVCEGWIMSSQIRSIDEELARLKLPMDPAVLWQALDALIANCADAYDFVADQGARKARECWIASRFLMAHSKRTGRQYEVTRLITDTPDIEYRNATQPQTILSVEATELVNPNEKRNEKWLQRKQQREACKRAGQAYEPSFQHLSQEALEAERRTFSDMASNILNEKRWKDYGPNCTLVLYVNLWLFGDEPIREFVTAHTLPEAVRFREIWFLYNEEIIPMQYRTTD